MNRVSEPEGRGGIDRSNRARVPGLEEGVLVGSSLGFLETLLLCGTGTLVPVVYRALVFPSTLLAWISIGVGLGSFGVVLASLGFARVQQAWTRKIPFLMLALPVVLFALSGGEPSGRALPAAARSALRFGVPASLLLALWVVRGKVSLRGEERTSLTGFAGLALATLAVSVTANAIRRVGTFDLLDLSSHHQGRLMGLLGAALAYAAVVLAVTRRANLRPLAGGRLVAAALVSALSSVAAASASIEEGGRPRLPEFAATDGRADGPPTLLITLDTVRRDHVSCYGYGRRTTPHLDAFAAKSTLFQNALATSSYTLSSHASLFTGLLPSEHGAHRIPYDLPLAKRMKDFALPASQDTLAEALRRRGYRTGAIAANAAYLGEWTGLQQGFEYYRVPRNWRTPYWPVSMAVLVRLFPALSPPSFAKHSIFSASAVTDSAIEWFRKLNGRPSFLFLNYMEAHAPYRPPSPYDRRFLPDGAGWSLLPPAHRPPDLKVLPGPQQLRLQEALYDGEIAFLDAEVGRLLDSLAASGMLDPMLVVITSDHGEYFGEHGLLEHGLELYEEVLRIPLIVKLPGQTEGTEVTALTSLQDLRGIIERVIDGARGESAMVAGRSDTRPRVVAQDWVSERTHELDPRRFGSPYLHAIYEGPLKLIQRAHGPSELFDVRADATEQQNFFRIDPKAAAAHETRLQASLPRGFGLHSSFESQIGVPGPDDVEALRALGYVH
jgi:arylsulfatase A-like enzyme